MNHKLLTRTLRDAFTALCTLKFSFVIICVCSPSFPVLKPSNSSSCSSLSRDSWHAVSAIRSDIRAWEMAIEGCVTHFLNGSATSLSFPSECTTWESKTMGEHDCQRIKEKAFGKWITGELDGLVLHFIDLVLLQIALTGVLYSIKAQKNISLSTCRGRPYLEFVFYF